MIQITRATREAAIEQIIEAFDAGTLYVFAVAPHNDKLKCLHLLKGSRCETYSAAIEIFKDTTEVDNYLNFRKVMDDALRRAETPNG